MQKDVDTHIPHSNPSKVPQGRICRRRSWWSTWCRAGCRYPGAASWCPGRWCWRAEASGHCGDGSRTGADGPLPQTLAVPAPSGGSTGHMQQTETLWQQIPPRLMYLRWSGILGTLLGSVDHLSDITSLCLVGTTDILHSRSPQPELCLNLASLWCLIK